MSEASAAPEPPPTPESHTSVLVIGAGLAGLEAARRLQRAGRSVVVVDKSRGLGGRCATRRIDGQPVDHGAPFLHGQDPALLELARSVPGPRLEGWPARVVGAGAPCHPAMVTDRGFRIAWPGGMTTLSKFLGEELDVRRQTRITALHPRGGILEAQAEDGTRLSAATVLLALPVEQALALLAPLADPALAPVRAMLNWFSSDPALTVLAGYPLTGPQPGFDLLLPDDNTVFQAVVHDSAKRQHPHSRALVFHTRPAWAREHLEQPRDQWQALLLAAAGTLLGDWARTPTWTSTHRWRYARVPAGLGLSAPLVTLLRGGARLALAGEALDPHGGLEGAWRSGHRVADLLHDPGLAP